MNQPKTDRLRLFIYILLAFLPVMILRDYSTSNELRYLSIADEALHNGTWFSFTNHGLMYADKPPLYLWFVMLTKLLFGHYEMWFLSLFSFLPAVGVASLFDRWTAPVMDREHRLIAVLMLFNCGIFAGLTFFLRMDMLMTLFIALSFYVFYKMLHGEGRRCINALLFPLFLFLGIFTKGPLGLLIPLAGTIVFLLITHRTKFIRQCWGWRTWSVLLVLTTLWFVAAYSEAGWPYLYNLLFHQTLGRAYNAFHHAKPFYFYAESIWYVLAPWSLFVIGVIVAAARRHLILSEIEKFFFTIVCTTFVGLSLVSSKLAVYLLPLIPFAVYLAVMLLPKFRWNRWLALSLSIPCGVCILSLPVVMILGRLPQYAYLHHSMIYLTAVVATLTGILTLHCLYRRKRMVFALLTALSGLFIGMFTVGCAVPVLNPTIGYGTICREVSRKIPEGKHADYCAWRMSHAENMDVYLGDSVHVSSSKLWDPSLMKRHGAILFTKEKRVKELPDAVRKNEICREGPCVAFKIP